MPVSTGSPRARMLVVLLGAVLLPVASSWAVPPQWGYLGLSPPRETGGNLDAFGKAGMSLSQAIVAADQGHGTVLEIGFVKGNGATGYEATVLVNGELRFRHVDPATGSVSDTSRRPVAKPSLNARARRDLATMAKSPLDLAHAVATAEQVGGGHAISAGIEQLQGRPQYLVRTVADGQVRSVIVDPLSGRAAPPA